MKPIKLKVSPFQPLLKFPLLVQIEIIKSMKPSEQYFLSKCSKRTYRAVKLSIPKKQNPEIWIHPISPSVYFFLRIAGARFCLFKTYFREYNRTHEYLCDLFSAPSDVHLEADGTSVKEIPDETFLKAGSVKKSILTRTTESMHQSIHRFSKLHPNQEFVHLQGTYVNELCMPDSYRNGLNPGRNFFETKNLFLSHLSGLLARDILPLFQGQHVLIEDAIIHRSFIEKFVEDWMKTKNDRLETAIVKLHPRNTMIYGFIEDLKFEKFSGSSRFFQYDSIIKGYHEFPKGLFDISDGWEVIRVIDGKVATIKVTRDYFMFLVW